MVHIGNCTATHNTCTYTCNQIQHIIYSKGFPLRHPVYAHAHARKQITSCRCSLHDLIISWYFVYTTGQYLHQVYTAWTHLLFSEMIEYLRRRIREAATSRYLPVGGCFEDKELAVWRQRKKHTNTHRCPRAPPTSPSTMAASWSSRCTLSVRV